MEEGGKARIRMGRRIMNTFREGGEDEAGIYLYDFDIIFCLSF